MTTSTAALPNMMQQQSAQKIPTTMSSSNSPAANTGSLASSSKADAHNGVGKDDNDGGRNSKEKEIKDLTALVDSSDDVALLLNEMIASANVKADVQADDAAVSANSLLTLDRNLSDLLGRLSVLGHDCSTSLDRSMRDVGGRVMPRLTWDLQYMRESAEGVRESLKSVERRTSEVRHRAKDGDEDEDGQMEALMEGDLLAADEIGAGGGSSSSLGLATSATTTSAPDVLRRLVRLDKLKTRLVAARDVLREAESWSTLESETGAYLAAGDWRRASARLSEAAKSLRVFKKASKEYDERKRLLAGLQGELEQRLGAVLKEMLTGKAEETQEETTTEEEMPDPLSLKEIHAVFTSMDRTEEFKEIYFRCRREPLLASWSTAHDNKLSATSLLELLYHPLSALLTSESQSIPDVFDRPIEALVALLHSTLESLTPTLPERLEEAFDVRDDPEALPELIACYQVTERFAGEVESLLERTATSSRAHSPLPSPDLPNASHSRRASRRFSRSLAGPFDPASLAPTQTAAPQPSLLPSGWDIPLYEPFVDYQSEYGDWERRHLVARFSRQASNDLQQRVQNSTQPVEEAIGRCRAFTHGYGLVGLVEAIDASEAELFEASRPLLAIQTPTTSATTSAAVDELDDLAGLGDEAQQAPIRSGLSHLRSCRGCDRLLQDLQIKVVDAVRQGQTSARTSGGTSLLQQSTLHSMDLSRLTTGATAPQLGRARQALTSLTAEAQKELQRTILSPIQDLLTPYPTLPVWSKSDKPTRGGLSIPTFSLSPTNIISQVAESLLNLLRLFELYANDSGLAYSLETLPYVDRDGLRAVLEQTSHANNSIPSDLVVSAWVSSLTFCLLAYLTLSLLPSMRPPLTAAGAAQLATDLSYLGNAVKALDVEWEELETWRQAAECKTPPTAQEIKQKGDVWRMMATLRQWPMPTL